jgi:3-mercaptopyruvate sulfurtransferase SseA
MNRIAPLRGTSRGGAGKVLLDGAYGLAMRGGGRLVQASEAVGADEILVQVEPALPLTPVISAVELRYALESVPGRVRILNVGREAATNVHIRNAIHWNPSSLLATGRLPRADAFAKSVSDLGIDNAISVVIYDDGSCEDAVAWWLLQVFGHERVSVLQGGIQSWIDAGGELARGKESVQSTRQNPGMVVDSRGCLGSGGWKLGLTGFQAHLKPSLYKSPRQLAEILKGAEVGQVCRISAGEGKSSSVQIDEIFNSKDKFLRPPEQIAEAFSAAGVDVTNERHPIVSVGTLGMAAVASLSLASLGRPPELCPVHATEWNWGGGNIHIP